MADLQLDLPNLRRPLYWELEVSNYSIWVRLKKRPFRLWRIAIESIARDSISHKGELTQEVLDQVSAVVSAMVANATPADQVHSSLIKIIEGRAVKVVLDR